MMHELKVTPLVDIDYQSILTPEALDFLYTLEKEFRPKREKLLRARQEKQKEYDLGKFPNFLAETAFIREADWKVNPLPEDLLDRRVEITGPVEAKMIINALNSGAKVFMADFEDSLSPTWRNCIQGQLNLREAVKRTLTFTDAHTQKRYTLKQDIATLMVRPRGWHLEEAHVQWEDQAISASLFDFAMCFFHNAKALIAQGSGPYFYLPKLESHQEAALWNEVFIKAQQLLSIPQGTIKATVLIETISAAFEMEEILYALKEHSAGLNCGRWDYIFSFIKKFRNHAEFVLPDRQTITMDKPFLKAYVDLLIATCHKRGVHAMGGMSAYIPIKDDMEANEQALAKVIADKTSEVLAGHDGTWVAHPGLIPVAMEVFNKHMFVASQIQACHSMPEISAEDLLKVPEGDVTEEGVRLNIRVGIQYLYNWLLGNGCVPLYHMMEDAATAEICRAQLWQWLKFCTSMDTGKPFTAELFKQWLQEEINLIQSGIIEEGKPALKQAIDLFVHMVTTEEFDEFLTLPAYQLIKEAL